jgi:hypothetical protein
MIASIQGGITMISNMSTIISFICLIVGTLFDIIVPLDCLGFD